MSLKEKAESKAKEYQVADVCRVWNNGCPNIYYASMEMFEWTKQELIDKACEWLENNLVQDTSVITGGYVHINFENAIKEFRKAMEG